MADKPVAPESSSELGRIAGRPTQILNFSLEKRVTKQGIQSLLEKVYELAGCRNCGLLGFDVRFHAIDPDMRAQFQGIDGLVDVSTTVGTQIR
jgi:hypothetical protein